MPGPTDSGGLPSAAAIARSVRSSQEGEEQEAREDIRGFRQWTSGMQEDLLVMRNVLVQEDPALDTSSKSFARQLMSLFKDKHPGCMESERSLLSKLKEPSYTAAKEAAPLVKLKTSKLIFNFH